MFDLSWGEIAVIGAVALIVIGPKELPGVLRGLGQTIAKMRAMASDFQYQFNQALREAEVDKVKEQVSELTSVVDAAKPAFDPVGYARDQIKSVVDDVKTQVTQPGAQAADEIGKAFGPERPGDPLSLAVPPPETYSVDPASLNKALDPGPPPSPYGDAMASVAAPEPPPAPEAEAEPAPKKRRPKTA